MLLLLMLTFLFCSSGLFLEVKHKIYEQYAALPISLSSYAKKSSTSPIIARLASTHMRSPSTKYTGPILNQAPRTAPSPPMLTSQASGPSVGKLAGHMCPSWQTTHPWPSCSSVCETYVGRHRPRAGSGPYH